MTQIPRKSYQEDHGDDYIDLEQLKQEDELRAELHAQQPMRTDLEVNFKNKLPYIPNSSNRKKQ